MFKLLFQALLKIREAFQAIAGRYFQKLLKSDGKLKYLSPDNWRKLLTVAALAFFALIIILQLLNRSVGYNDSFSDYQKEIRSDAGLRMRDSSGKALFDKDPLSGATIEPKEPEIDLGRTVQPGQNSVEVSVKNSNGAEAEVPAASDCFALTEKAKAGQALSVSDRSKVRSCIENNVIPLSTEEKQALLALSSGDLTQSEREAILRALGEKAQPLDKDLSSVIAATVDQERKQELVDGLNKELRGDAIEVAPDEARDLSKLMAEKQKQFSDAIVGSSKILGGQSPDDKEKSNILEAVKDVKGGEKAALENPNLSADKERALQSLLNDVAERQERIQELENRLAEAQALAREPVEKLQKGLELSKEEQAAIDRLSQIRKELDGLKALQEKRQRTLIELTSRLQKTVAQAAVAIQKSIPSGVYEGYADYEPLDCKNIKPLPVKIRHKKTAQSGKNMKLAMNARPALEFYKIEDEIKKNGVEYEGKRLDPSQVLGDQKINVAELFVAKGDSNHNITLGPETKIAAILDTEIIVAANGGGQAVRIKILQDVYDAKSRKLIIPKNSIAIGRASSFDENTGIMDFTLNKISVGSGNTLEVALRVGSGDGSMGLKGQVRDTRGRFLLGAFVTAFTAGALDFVSQNTISQYQQSQRLVTALQGSALSGGAEVANRISSMFANDLMNTPSVFFAPRGLPIVLYPE